MKSYQQIKAERFINDLYDAYGEWLEMSDNPDQMMVGIILDRLIQVSEYTDFLKKRIELCQQIHK